MSHSSTIAMDVNPQIRAAALQVGILLDDYHYSPHARDAIVRHITATGCVTDAPGLDREDQADAEAVFVAELEPVPLSSDAWDRDTGVLFDAELLVTGHPWPYGPQVGDDDRDFDAAMAALEDLPTANGWTPLPPISGGAPLNGDRDDFEAWLSQVDAGYPPADQPASDWPALKTADDRRKDRRDVEEFFRLHPDA
jgi:hypothetical protein